MYSWLYCRLIDWQEAPEKASIYADFILRISCYRSIHVTVNWRSDKDKEAIDSLCNSILPSGQGSVQMFILFATLRFQTEQEQAPNKRQMRNVSGWEGKEQGCADWPAERERRKAKSKEEMNQSVKVEMFDNNYIKFVYSLNFYSCQSEI